MHHSNYLESNYNDKTRHAALLHDFTGQTIEQLNKTGIVYVGLGFSYQEHYTFSIKTPIRECWKKSKMREKIRA